MSNIISRLPILCLAVALLLGGPTACTPEQPEAPPDPPPAAKPAKASLIPWRTWGPEAFAEAQKLNRPVLLDLTAVWCHWCHRLDEDTWNDPKVAAFVNARFIPVQVWADERPDIERRYIDGGWPTVAVLNHEGFAFGSFGYTPPERMIEKLAAAEKVYKDDPKGVAQEIARARKVRAVKLEVPKDLAFDHGLADRFTRSLLLQRLNRRGIFSAGSPWFPQPQIIRFAFLQHARTGDQNALDLARKLLDGMAGGELSEAERKKNNIHGLYDNVAGGFFRYTTRSNWRIPHYEKMLRDNAALAKAYLEAYAATRDKNYRRVAEGALRYVRSTLTDPKTGRLYGSQDADLFAHVPGKKMVDGEEYYPLSAAERAKIGVPHVDTTTYTDTAAMMISAYVTAYRVLGDESYRTDAERAMASVLTNNVRKDNEVYHFYNAAGKRGGQGILADYLFLARALLDLYQIRSREAYLARAEALMAKVEAEFLDKETSAYTDIRIGKRPLGALENGRFPAGHNALAALNLIHLGKFRESKQWDKRVGSLLRYTVLAVGMDYASQPETAQIAIALENHLTTPALLRVVGRENDKATDALMRISFRSRLPLKLVQRLDVETSSAFLRKVFLMPKDPKRFAPQIRLCTRQCYRPARTDVEIGRQIRSVTKSRKWSEAGIDPPEKKKEP